MSINSKFTINNVLLNQESLQKKNKYSCPICFEYFYKKSVYQCRSGHYACRECWEKSLETKQECMICRSEVNSFKDLSRYEENGCREIINVDQLDIHIENCIFKFEKCSHDGCDIVLRLNSLEEHENKCDYKLVKCEYCACDDIIQMELENHHDIYPKFPIDCPQGCSIMVERDQIKSFRV
ncbi:hypothetical protein DDB_G0290935 [Dictyostelium discoideum AX4]|uniref:E3 ubiquitin-protein ligase Sina-like RING finger domain-containing protein n=1 Tax=Dictyostelium discoideum TaxID=44689 RepID=Q54FD3_DICDI|nr:hypothetical protein DDB_G0290935 [Dictyostelium discoideum AX4]EAL61983.1 hypothetical protein DDB_G0290935 [Dictyostelium discoideum AX4]|eukprot:XP_635489.1 hypothetical protein DDB_G0290935 [Dictyostelium discoideum AX4]